MPIPMQPLAATPQMQMRNRIAMQMMRPLGAPAPAVPRPAVMPPQFSAVDPNRQVMQQQQAAQLQQQQALGELFNPRIR